jgi:eukaryotic-like serine/threonine-protein kinase
MSTTGRRLGDYELLEEIARGGMGIVYRARQNSLNRIVAVKVVLSGHFARPEMLQRFRAEAEIIAQLKHPNIVAVHEVGEAEGQPYFSMEYVAGRTLAQIVQEQPLPVTRAAAYAKSVAEAVHHAHGHGVLHRDLKPSNVLIDENDQPRITDFGLAKRVAGAGDNTSGTAGLAKGVEQLIPSSELTVTGQILGTPNYLPPEQALGRHAVIGPASDIYALGALLYHLLARRPPFVAETLETTLDQVLHQEPISPRLFNPSVPPDLETICLKCLEKEPQRRYPTAQDLADELARFLRHEPILARPVSRPEKAWHWCRRKPAVAALGTALVLASATGIGAVLHQWRRAERIAEAETRQRERAASAEFSARQYAYAADMRAAQAGLGQNNQGLTMTLLRRYIPKPGEADCRGIEWRYLWQESRSPELARSYGHPENWVQDAALSPNGQHLVTALTDTIRVWDIASGQVVIEFPRGGSMSPKKSLGFSPDGKWLASPGANAIELRETTHWQIVKQLGPTTNISPVAVSADGRTIVSGGCNGQNAPVVQVWDVPSGACRVLTNCHVMLYNLSVSSNGSRVVFSPAVPLFQGSGSITLWDRERDTTFTLATEQDVTALALSADGEWLASGHYSGDVCFFRLSTRERIGPFRAHRGMVYGLTFSPDAAWLATGGNDQLIHFWTAGTTNRVRTLKGHESEVYGLAFSADGRKLVSASKDGTAKLWNLQVHGGERWTFTLPASTLPIGLLPDGTALLTVDQGGMTTRLWRLPDGAPAGTQSWADAERRGCRQLHFFPRNRLAVGVATNGTVHLWDLSSARHLSAFSVGLRGFVPQCLSPDQRWLLGAAYDPSTDVTHLVLCDLLNTQRITPFDFFCLPAHGAAFSPDTLHLAFSCLDERESIKVWDLPAGRLKQTLWTTKRSESFGVLAMAYSPDGAVLAVGSYSGEIRLWSTRTGTLFDPVLRGHIVAVNGLCFSGDGRTLASSGGDLGLRLWNLASRQEMLLIPDATMTSGGPGQLVDSYYSSQADLMAGDRCMVWRSRNGSVQASVLPSLAEIDARASR